MLKNWTIWLTTIIMVCASAPIEIQAAERLGGSVFAKRRKSKTFRQQQADLEKNREEKAKQEEAAAIEKAKEENPTRTLDIRTFCGYKFGEDGEDRTEANRKPFGGYKTATLKFDDRKGLVKVSVLNDDADRIKDVRKEIDRIVKMCERNFNIKFTGKLETKSDAEYENKTNYHYGWGRSFIKMETKAATHWWYRISETFKNFTITVRGEREVSGKMLVELTIYNEVNEN